MIDGFCGGKLGGELFEFLLVKSQMSPLSINKPTGLKRMREPSKITDVFTGRVSSSMKPNVLALMQGLNIAHAMIIVIKCKLWSTVNVFHLINRLK